MGFSMIDDTLPHNPVWYVLDVVGMTCGVALLISHLNLHSELETILDVFEHGYKFMSYDKHGLDAFLGKMEELLHDTVEWYYIALYIYPVNLLIRLLMAFHTQP